jgi:FecR protein
MTTMKFHRIDFPLHGIHEVASLLQRIIVLVVLLASSLSVWASSGGCVYGSSGTGMGGTGNAPGSTGMGGTGNAPEEGSQMQPAGNVVFSRGMVEAQSMGRTRLLGKGAQVCVGETIKTADSGTVQIRMLDTGFISVRPDTELKISAFQFDGKEDGTERTAFYLIQGAFRAVTGLIGHLNKENYKIETPTATIGIRGTDHEPMFIPTPLPGQAAPGIPGTYDKVNSGGVYIRTAAGSVDVRPNEVGFAPIESKMAPVILREIPRFYLHEGTGVESRGNSSDSDGRKGVSGEMSDRSRNPEHNSRSERNAPVFKVPEPNTSRSESPEIHSPENQHSGMRAPDAHTQGIEAPDN